MNRRVSLRKCSDHPDCQLQRVDDGEWEHTPGKRSLSERLSGRVSLESQKQELQEALAKADFLQRILWDLHDDTASFLAGVKAETVALPKTLDLQAKANRAREFLDSQVKIAQEAGERLQRALQRVDREADRQAALLSRFELLETRILDTERQAEETLALATERAAQADALLANAQRRQADLDRVDAVYGAVDQLAGELRVAVADIKASDQETRRQIEKERRERLGNNEKIQRQLRNLGKDK